MITLYSGHSSFAEAGAHVFEKSPNKGHLACSISLRNVKLISTEPLEASTHYSLTSYL
jgi:hypothetical protein